MTPRQIELARDALGLRPTRLISHRNHFVAGPGHPDYGDWISMVVTGHAWRRERKVLPPGDVMFHLTRAGAELALLPGDILNPEDWS